MEHTENDPYHLERFVAAQDEVFETVLEELRHGEKQTHWMWFIFPQMEGLGSSPLSRYYSIKSEDEARQYLNHPVLGPRLIQCSQILLTIEDRAAEEIFGSPDDLKLRSSMTLFAAVSEPDSVFLKVLAMYFFGEPDRQTLHFLHTSEIFKPRTSHRKRKSS